MEVAAGVACAVARDGPRREQADRVIRPPRTADAERPWE